MVANDVSSGSGTFGGKANRVHLIFANGSAENGAETMAIETDAVESWPAMSKEAVAERLAARIADALEGSP
jgi:phosphopantothenoylcysteine decarboxylase/phosphopantothenate--cysteine ligase